LLISLSLSFAQSGTTVRVHVVNSLTKASLADVNLTINELRTGKSGQLSGHTNEAGDFEQNADFSGAALISARMHGFRITSAGMMGKSIEIQKGAKNEMTLEMLPLGVLAGRVLDQFGDPVRHAIVSTLQDAKGRDGLEPYVSLFAATTDDLG